MHKETQSNDVAEPLVRTPLDKLVVNYRVTGQGSKIACLTLNKPKALNALDLDMIRMSLAYLEQWRHDDTIVGVFIDSSSEKAFCAGGDIVSLYQAITTPVATPSQDNSIETEQDQSDTNSGVNVSSQNAEMAAEFFAQEYRLDYCLHSYPKPVIAWGNGIIMGGGLGIFAGAHIKIVTEFSRVAMPEINIGLFPDVGASYFLNKMPKGVGRFLGLTATSMNAQDCINTNLADFFISNQNKSVLLDRLTQLPVFTLEAAQHCCDEISNEPDTLQHKESMVGNLDDFKDELGDLDELGSLEQIQKRLASIKERFSANKIIAKAYDAFLRGSPITAHLVINQLQKGKQMALADCFRMELNMAYGCCASGEFKEGIRALLIDKDNTPNWLYKSFEEVPENIIENHFNHYSSSDNPLAQLELTFGEHYA